MVLTEKCQVVLEKKNCTLVLHFHYLGKMEKISMPLTESAFLGARAFMSEEQIFKKISTTAKAAVNRSQATSDSTACMIAL